MFGGGKPTEPVRLVQLNVHPLKSGSDPAGPVRVGAAARPRGRPHLDAVDRDGRLVSAREVHELFRVVADTPTTDADARPAPCACARPGTPTCSLDQPGRRPPGAVRLFSLDLEAVPAGPAADAWLRVGARPYDVRLVWCDDPTRRSLQPGFSEPGDHAAFPDAFPVTWPHGVARRLNDWIAERAVERGEEPPAPSAHRAGSGANLVVDGDVPFAEDDWSRGPDRRGALPRGKPVDRCVMTTIDPQTLDTAKEPIRTLARHRLVGRQDPLRRPPGAGLVGPDPASATRSRVDLRRHPRSTGRSGSVIQPLQLPG